MTYDERIRAEAGGAEQAARAFGLAAFGRSAATGVAPVAGAAAETSEATGRASVLAGLKAVRVERLARRIEAMAVKAGQYEESKHPRGAGGKWAQGTPHVDPPGAASGRIRHAVLVIGNKRWRGPSHFQAMIAAAGRRREPWSVSDKIEKEGFETESGHFLDRDQAASYVGKQGQWLGSEHLHLAAVDGQLYTQDAVMAAGATTSKRGCLMAMVQGTLEDRLLAWTKENVPDAELDLEEGRETESHVTAFYGFNLDFDVEKLAWMLQGRGEVKFELGKVSRFECPKYDVLKVDVRSKDLEDLNKRIGEAFKDDVTPSEHEYHPHLTLAYVKKGACKELDGRDDFEGERVTVNELLYSLPEKQGRQHILIHASSRSGRGDSVTAADGDPWDLREHSAARDDAERTYRRTVDAAVSALAVEALAEAARKKKDEKAKKRRREELFAALALLLFGAGLTIYRTLRQRLAKTIPGQTPGAAGPTPAAPVPSAGGSGTAGGLATPSPTGQNAPKPTPGPIATGIAGGPEDAEAFAAGRASLVADFPKRVLEALDLAAKEAAAEGRDAATAVHDRADQASAGQGRVVSETEAQAAYGKAMFDTLKAAGFETKVWTTMEDDKVRPSHVECGNQGEVPMGQRFANGLMYPGDPSGGPEEVCSCRCWLVGGRRMPGTGHLTASEPHDVSGEARDAAGRWTAGEPVSAVHVSQHERHSKLGRIFIVREHDDKRMPASPTITVGLGHGPNLNERIMVRTVSEYFAADEICGNVRLVEPGSLGRFQAGGKDWSKAGEWNNETKTAVSVPDPEVLAHELGHAEFDFAKDRAAIGLMEARDREMLEKGDKFNPWFQAGEGGLLRADAKLADPRTADEELYNAVLEFRNTIGNNPDRLPTEYAKSWVKEPIVDKLSIKLMLPATSPAGRPVDIGSELWTHRTFHEAYAEFSAGRVLDKMVKDGLLSRSEVGKPEFKKMDGPEGRDAYLKLKAAVDKAVKAKTRPAKR